MHAFVHSVRVNTLQRGIDIQPTYSGSSNDTGSEGEESEQQEMSPENSEHEHTQTGGHYVGSFHIKRKQRKPPEPTVVEKYVFLIFNFSEHLYNTAACSCQ